MFPIRLFALVALVALVSMFAGCGSKGSLYLPKKEPAAQNRATPAEPAAPEPATN
jgi:predicted small lipoprotein YifL